MWGYRADAGTRQHIAADREPARPHAFLPLHNGNIGVENSRIPAEIEEGTRDGNPFVGTTRAVRGYRQPPYLDDYLGYDFVDRDHTHFMLSPAVTLVEMRVWPAARHRDVSVEIRPDQSGGQRFMKTFPAVIAEERWALEKQQQMFNYPSDGYFEVFLRSDSALRRARQIPTCLEREERAARPQAAASARQRGRTSFRSVFLRHATK